MAHQSLYRRYRPQRFAEVRGQDHVVAALRSAVAEGRVGHAYLFSGPRGTGKTSTARILAKALNCEDLRDGEPCGVCEACRAIQAGSSYDLQELDAASNNKVEDVRELIARVALGSPGRTKVYILDEVHMLSAGASNALLKTLEEPPDHVVFVLATTDPQKVLPTIRSRTQHFQFHLLPADELAEHVRWVIGDAGLAVDDAGVEQVLRAGGGSARDTLSALDQVAAGGIADEGDHAEALVDAVVTRDVGAALTAVSAATTAGRDPRVLGEALLAHLRDVFLRRMGGPLGHLSDVARGRVDIWADALTDREVTRALEEVGEALLAMRQAPDPRIPLEVALVHLTRQDGAATGAGGDAVADLAARVARLEAQVASGTAAAPASARPGADESSARPDPAEDGAPGPGPQARRDAPVPAAPSGRSSGRPGDAARAALASQGRPSGSGARPSRPTEASSAPPPPPPSPKAAARRQPEVEAPDPSEASSPPPPPPSPEAAARRQAEVEAPGPSEAPAADVDPAGRDRSVEERSAAATGVRPRPPAPDATPPAAAARDDVAASDAARDAAASDAAAPAPAAAPVAAVEAAPTPAPAAGPGAAEREWEQHVLPKLGGLTKALYGAGVVAGATDDQITIALPNGAHRDRCEQKRSEVERVLAEVRGTPTTVRLTVGSDPGPRDDRPARSAGSGRPAAGTTDAADEAIDLDDLVDAPTQTVSGVERLTEAFPGAQVIDDIR